MSTSAWTTEMNGPPGRRPEARERPTRSSAGQKPAVSCDAVRFAAFTAEAKKLGVTIAVSEPLARQTTFRIGGPADLYVAAQETRWLDRLAGLAEQHDIPILILGGGSNVLVSDAGVRGLVIANRARGFGLLDPTGTQVVADSGVALAGLARWTIRAGLSGLEWAVSIPGTVGGAVIGNAGAHGSEIADTLLWAVVSYPGQDRQTLTVTQLGYSYRSSSLKQQLSLGEARPIVLAAGFQLGRDDVTAMNARAEAYVAKRRATQPAEPSAGSVFRNPPGDHAARLVEAAGLKGSRIGGARISPRHANFIVNETGSARAADVIGLIDLMRTRVYENSGIELIPEIVFVGQWPQQPPYARLREKMWDGKRAMPPGETQPDSDEE